MPATYIFLDESGNFDFKKGVGTQYFVICAMITKRPMQTHALLRDLKYELLEEGSDIKYFHAAPDQQSVRNRVFKAIQKDASMEFHYIYVDKYSLPKELKSRNSLYAYIGETLLEHCFRLPAIKTADKVVVIFDKVLHKQEGNTFEAAVKSKLKRIGKSHNLYFHQVGYDFNAQIADYGAWSLYVKLSRKEERPMKALGCRRISIAKILS